MNGRWHLAGSALIGAVLVAASPPHAASISSSRDGPIPGFSGGFGESSCDACHFGGELNEAPGRLVLSGVPERYVAGAVYPLTLTLIRPGMAVGGFQLTARFEEGGGQAGSLASSEEHGRLEVTTDRSVQYAHHVRAGTRLVASDTARWTLQWTAPIEGPADARGTILVHVAANAADGDDSQLGDRIYTSVAASRPQR